MKSHRAESANAASTAGVTSRQDFAGTIRPPREPDHLRIAELAGQLSYPSTAEQIAGRLNEIAGSFDHAVFVAEMPGGEVAGWIAVDISRSLERDARGEITGLVVDERFRSQGVGKNLLARAEQWTRARGCDFVGLRSNVIRDRAHAFYLREGYEHTKTQKTFRKNLSRKS